MKEPVSGSSLPSLSRVTYASCSVDSGKPTQSCADRTQLWRLSQFVFFPILGFVLLVASVGVAQEVMPAKETIESGGAQPTDGDIQERIKEIFQQLSLMKDIAVSVTAGVVTLSGTVPDAGTAESAEAIALRVAGVVTIQNEIDRDFSVVKRLAPSVNALQSMAADVWAAAPLLLLSLLVFAILAKLSWMLTGWETLWLRLTPNLFVADLAATTVRVGCLIAAAVVALTIIDATTLLSAILGTAGVVGLAVGFAVKDTIENYIASVMLSLRQPFRPKDHVEINGAEGRIVRLTSRATVLLTLDGNHLRIPNAEVFKATILNYTRNPERRLSFELGVDADDDPLAAIETGIKALRQLDFTLDDPAPIGVIQYAGDSNIVLFFGAWIDQRRTDFGKSRSIALSAAKNALETHGFSLPEPIYRLRFDGSAGALEQMKGAAKTETTQRKTSPKTDAGKRADLDTQPDTYISAKVDEERSRTGSQDLLSGSNFVEE